MQAAPCLLALSLLASATLQAEELSPRVGLSAFFTQPTDTGGKLYGSGWKVNLAIHVHREALVEGRVRMEFGEFSEGKTVFPYQNQSSRHRAHTRLVGYDWLIPLGQKRERGMDLILGIGGAHWFRDTQETAFQGTPYAYSSSYSDSQFAFAGTVGFRFRLNRQVVLEVHQVLTSVPGNQRDFEDGELSHTAFGVGYRF